MGNCVVEMRKVVDYPKLYVIVDSRSSKSHGCSKSMGVHGNLLMPQNMILMVDCRRWSYVEALVGRGHYQEFESE